MLSKVKKIILVLSGKGGVGKSTVAVELALTLANEGKKVGLLDIDLCGPSVPTMLGLTKEKVTQGESGWIPVSCPQQENLKVMSIGFLLSSPESAVIWRGPKKNAMIRQFLVDVDWDELDFLIIDTPPGTSDEHISVVETLQAERKADGAIMVSTPQNMSIADVRREISFCKKADIPIIGLVENMSGYVCPNCSECTQIFGKGGAQSLANLTSVPFITSIPIDPRIGDCLDAGKDFVSSFKDSKTAECIKMISSVLQS